ncbi:MAG: hypothetical protein WCC84_03140 [Candidatus Cybelea sp.]
MSLATDANKVEEVLLADGCHRVVSDTFELDSYEYVSASGPTQFEGGRGGDFGNGLYLHGAAASCPTRDGQEGDN